MLARADALARKPRMVCVAIEETWNGLGKGKGKKARSFPSLARLEGRGLAGQAMAVKDSEGQGAGDSSMGWK